MGADWYYCSTFFGYKIAIPDDITYRKFVKMVSGLSDNLQSPFRITGILSNFHSRMEGMEMDEREYLDNDANIVIGFKPDGDLNKMVELNKNLLEYITDNPIFEGFDISKTPAFYSGIDWFEYYVEYDDSDDDSEYEEGSDEEETDEEETDDEDGDEEESGDKEADNKSSDSEHSKVHPQ